MNKKLHYQHLMDAVDHNHAGAECHNTDCRTLKEAGETITHTANSTETDPRPGFQEALLLRLKEERHVVVEKPMIHRFSQWIKDHITLRSLLPAAGMALVAIIVAGVVAFLPTPTPGNPGVVPVVQAGTDFVSVSLPVRIAFPYKQAQLDDIVAHLEITPTPPTNTLTYAFDGEYLTITHAKNLRYNTEYTVKILPGVMVGDTQSLTDEVSVTFRTRPRTGQQAKGGARTLYLNNYNLFTGYTLNAYDEIHEIPIENQDDGATYIFTVYDSSPTEFLRAYQESKNNYASGAWTPTSTPFDAKKRTVIDEQTNTYAAGFFTYSPALSDVGVYVVEVKKTLPPREAQSLMTRKSDTKQESIQYFFLVHTKLALLNERLGHELPSWVVDQQAAAGVEGATITMYERNGKELTKKTTNKDGRLDLEILQTDEKKPDYASVTLGNDFAFSAIDVGWWNSFYSGDWTNEILPFQAVLYTDRPIYKPGDTVSYKTIIRTKEDDGSYTQAPKRIHVTARELTYGQTPNIIYEKDLPTSGYGTAADAFALSSELKTGTYELSFTDNGKTIATTQFSVEFYQKPDAELIVIPEKEVVTKGDTLTITLNGRYFFGEPVRQKSGVVRLLGGWYGDTVGETNFTLDNEGGATVQMTIDNKIPTWYEGGTPLTIEASFADESGKQVIGRKVITVYTSEVGVSTKNDSLYWGLKTEEPQRIVFIVKDNVTTEPVSGIEATIVLEDAYGYTDQTILSTSTISNVLGEIELEHTFSAGGSYRVTVRYHDKRGNEAQNYFYVWVKPNGKSTTGDTIYSPNIYFSPNKETYRVGETAKVEIILPRSEGQLLWSLNTSVFNQMNIETIKGDRYELSIPITEALTPGFYIAGTLYHDDTFVEGSQFIAVDGKKLQVAVESNKSQAKPGENITLKIKTSDQDNKPVRAEASLSVIDKAIFSLKADQSADLYSSFYKKPEDVLKKRTSLEPVIISPAEGGGCFLAGTQILMANGRSVPIESIRPGDMILTREAPLSDRLVADKVVRTFKHTVQEYLIINNTLRVTPVHRIFISGRWQEVGQAKVGDWFINPFGERVPITSIVSVNEPVEVFNFETEVHHTYIADGIYVHNSKGGEDEIRKNFVDTAFWNAFVETNDKGEGSITLALPDNLTTWVARAKAVTKSTDLGQGSAELITHKDIIVRPFVPQFVRTNDTISIPVAIHNNTNKEQSLRLLATVAGGTITNESIRSVTLKANSITTVTWPITIANSKSLKLTVQAEFPNKTVADGVELTIPIYSKYNLNKQVLTAEGSTSFTVAVPSTISTVYSSAVLTLSPSLLGSLPDIMDKLTGYPYGCVEQTMTKQLPNILTAEYQSLLGLSLTTEKQKQLQAGFDRLANFQHDDGGFGWWESDDTNIWMTGYVLEGLWHAKQAKLLSGKEGTFDRLLTFTKEALNTSKTDEQIYLAYVLSQIDPTAARTTLETHARKAGQGVTYDPQSLGYIALGLYNIGKTEEAHQVLAQIKALQVDHHWQMEENFDYHGALKDTYSATGVNLLALLTIEGNVEEARPIIQWLMANRSGYEGLWGSTRQSAQILLALIRFVDMSQELSQLPTYGVTINGQPFATKPFANIGKPVTLVLPTSVLTNGTTITLDQSKEGIVYSTLVLNTYSDTVQPAAKAAPFTIRRAYLTPDGKQKTVFSAGDPVTVRLTVDTKQPLNYVMIEDYLPAGLEAINPNLDTSSGAHKGFGYGGWFYDAFDIRDHRVNLFQQRIWAAGEYVFEYMARVSYRGTFTAPGPRMELMYEPDTSATDASQTIHVQ